MKILNINNEWDFVASEITSSNKGGTAKRHLLFAFQILLCILSKIKRAKEKQILISAYRKQKKQYLII